MKLIRTLFVFTGLLTYAIGLNTNLLAKDTYKDPDAPTIEESKVLGWGPVKTPARKNIPEFLLKGTLVSFEKDEAQPGHYNVTILPVEVQKNSQRYIERQHFDNSVTISVALSKEQAENIQIGSLVQYNQYFERKVEQSIGNAAMVNYILHQEFTPSETPAVEYITKIGYYPIQYRNAIKGLELFKGKLSSDKALKDALSYHASKSPDAELKSEASALFSKIFKDNPASNCQENKETQTYVCQ